MDVTLSDGNKKQYRTVWFEHGTVKMINQPLLPHKFEIIEFPDFHGTANAIKTMVTRGAGAIGASAAYGMAQVVLAAGKENFEEFFTHGRKEIEATRPTAQNLFYATRKVSQGIQGLELKEAQVKAVEVAQKLVDSDVEACKKIGEFGDAVIKDRARLLTHCNAGWLAAVDWGTALAPMYAAKRNGKKLFVFADETRPRCQGARLTAWELANEGIEHAVIVDNAAGHYMKTGEIDLAIVGADRIAANGDTANKIGTYEKAVLAKENDIPFYIAAQTATIDFECENGKGIPIEEREEEEVTFMFGANEQGEMRRVRIAPLHCKARNPAFDVTPAKYITGIITEKGIIEPGKIRELKE